MTDPTGGNRRDFLKTTSVAVAAATQAAVSTTAHAAGSDTLKVGLIGCGGRGTGAVKNLCEAVTMMAANGKKVNVTIHALADLFPDHIEICKRNLASDGNVKDRLALSDDRCFTGFDAYQSLINSGVDLVLTATPPGFRPAIIEATVAAGKHLFAEKPVGVDGPGIRRVLKAAEEAKAKKLSVVAGTQRRHQSGYIEVMERIHDGALGEITGGQCYWNQGELWMKPRETSWSDMEWQIRNWLYFSWLSGDHICEQHVHNLDVMNWAIGSHPERAVGLGGRQVRTSPAFGNIFDHHSVDLEYPNGVHVMSMCRQIPNCEPNVSERVVGTNGTFSSHQGYRFTGKYHLRLRTKEVNPYVQEHIDLLESILAGKPLNELETVAESTLTAIMGRMATYTGKAVTWDQALNSKEDLSPPQLAFGPLPVAPVAVPGQTKLF